jgi:hypothetical protein
MIQKVTMKLIKTMNLSNKKNLHFQIYKNKNKIFLIYLKPSTIIPNFHKNNPEQDIWIINLIKIVIIAFNIKVYALDVLNSLPLYLEVFLIFLNQIGAVQEL